jgi:uncharacterized membrane protein (DUF2068 family)
MTQHEMPAAVRAITAYKTVKAAAELFLALLLVVLLPFGLPDALAALCASLQRHVTHAWASNLAALIESGSNRHGIVLGSIALGLDGSLTAIEAWALRARHWWGPWLVVAATGALLPFEVYELAREPRASRALLLFVNLAIVVYLAWRATRERQAQSPAVGRTRRERP